MLRAPTCVFRCVSAGAAGWAGFQLPAVTYLNFVLHHSIHHRGQLSMYLRPMGAKVPSIYGESYDAAEARKAAQQSA